MNEYQCIEADQMRIALSSSSHKVIVYLMRELAYLKHYKCYNIYQDFAIIVFSSSIQAYSSQFYLLVYCLLQMSDRIIRSINHHCLLNFLNEN